MREFNQYEVEMCDFLSEPDNFKNMLLIVNQFELVKRKLLVDFWEDFSKTFMSLIQEPSEWNVEILKGSEMSIFEWKVRVYKKSWLHQGNHEISFGWEPEHGRWYYGVIVNNSLKYHPEIHLRLEPYAKQWRDKHKARPATWWPFWKWESVNLSNQDELEKLLPSYRGHLVQHCVGLTFDLCKEFEAGIESVLNSLSREISPA